MQLLIGAVKLFQVKKMKMFVSHMRLIRSFLSQVVAGIRSYSFKYRCAVLYFAI